MQSLFTIGHSNQSAEAFIELLLAHNIAQVVDVRSFPASRHSPQFNREALSAALAERGIEYVYAGRQLGGMRRESYAQLRDTAGFRQAVRDLIVTSQAKATAMMCAEEDPNQCHRRFLITRALMEDFSFVDIMHIRRDASAQAEAGFPESAVQLTLGI